MVELIGDDCYPRTLVVPEPLTIAEHTSVSGSMVISGSNLYWYDGSNWQGVSGMTIA